jgi:hypothetical protein
MCKLVATLQKKDVAEFFTFETDLLEAHEEE